MIESNSSQALCWMCATIAVELLILMHLKVLGLDAGHCNPPCMEGCRLSAKDDPAATRLLPLLASPEAARLTLRGNMEADRKQRVLCHGQNESRGI